MKNEFLDACDHIVGATVNGVYQGIIVTVVIALAFRLFGRSNAATRYAIYFCLLLLLPGLILVHACRNWGNAHQDTALAGRGITETGSISPLTSSIAPQEASPPNGLAIPNLSRPRPIEPDHQVASFVYDEQTWDTDFEKDLFRADQPAATPVESTTGPQTAPADLAIVAAASSSPALASGVRPSSGAAILETGLTAEQPSIQPTRLAAPEPERTPLRSRIGLWAEMIFTPTLWNLPLSGKVLTNLSLLLLGFWLIISSLRLWIFFSRLLAIRNLKRDCAPASPELNSFFQRLCLSLPSKRNVQLKISSSRRSPMVLGFVHPVILLPSEAEGEAFEPILRHELAHVRRYDDWTNLTQHFVQSLLFFHPAIYWIGRQLSLDREIACDDSVLQQCRAPRAYALLLADLAGRMQGRLPAPLLAPGASTNKTQLKKRIDMILDTNRNASPHLGKTRLILMTAAIALVATVALAAAPRVVLARADTPDTPDPVAAPGTPATPELAQIPAPEPPDQPSPAPEGIGEGPRFKRNPTPRPARPALPPPVATPVAPGVPATPAEGPPGHAAVVAPVAPVAPVPAITPHPFVAPIPPRAVFAPQGPMVAAVPGQPRMARSPRPDGSIEERLARLEEMVRSLMEDKRPRSGNWESKFEYHLKDSEGPFKPEAKREKEIEMQKEHAKRDAERAAGEAKRAAKDAERSAHAEMREMHGRSREAIQRQMENMRRQLENLERQREQIKGQLERLKEQQESIKEQGDNSDDPSPGDNSADRAADCCGQKEPA